MPQFIPGIELSRRFYAEAVLPILHKNLPNLPHAAAHIGPGSDVLGFDTDRDFMMVEVSGDSLYFQTIARTGATIDAGKLDRQK